MSHQNGNFKRNRPEGRSMTDLVHLDGSALFIKKVNQVQTCQIAGSIVKEHVFRTRVARIDAAAVRTCMPLVDGCIKLQTGISTLPCAHKNFLPEIARIDCTGTLSCRALFKGPDIVVLNSLHELVGHPDGIV